MWNESRIFHETLDARLSMVQDASLKVRDYYIEQLASEDAIFYIAFVGEQAVGYICAKLQKTTPVFEKSFIGFIDGLYVIKEFRKLGIGRHLVDLAKVWFNEHGVSTVQLSVASKNDPGIKFWEKCGFNELMRRMHQHI